MQRTIFIDWKTIVLSLYWHSWRTILIEKGGFYNAGISFNHLQLFRLGTWVFQSTVLQTLGPDYLIHWVKIPSFLWSPRQRKMDPGAIVCEVTKSIVPAPDQIRLLASAAKVHRRVCLFTVTGQKKICPKVKLFPNFTSIPFDYLLKSWMTNYVSDLGVLTCLSWIVSIENSTFLAWVSGLPKGLGERRF